MASGRDVEVSSQQILQIQTNADLTPGTPLSETPNHVLHPILQPDGPTPGQPASHAPQQTYVILILAQVDANMIRPLQEIMLPLPQNRSASFQVSPPGQSAPFIMPEDANQAYALPSSITPASFPSQVAQLDGPTDASPRCPVCGQSFGRAQERRRHARTHLPHWLFCPFPGCPWRGDRPYTLPKHWAKTHANFGEAPRPEDCKIYNPDPLVQSVINGELLIEEMIAIAQQAVKLRAQELDRVGVWEDEWGRGQRV